MTLFFVWNMNPFHVGLILMEVLMFDHIITDLLFEPPKALFFPVGNDGCGMSECGKGRVGVGESW